MKLVFGKRTSDRVVGRLKKKARIRKKVVGTAERPRLSIYRSVNHIYAQLIDDDSNKTLAATSSLKLGGNGSNKTAAQTVGQKIAELAKEKNIENVVFDRNGFIYHGRVKALADSAREAGLKF